MASCAVFFCLLPLPAAAQPFDVPLQRDPRDIIGPCNPGIPPIDGIRHLPRLATAIEQRHLNVLAIGSSSTSGIGASSAQATYPALLKARLHRIYPDTAITVLNRGIPGETFIGAATRMRYEVLKSEPDLVLWQLGTNGALAKIPVDRLRTVVMQTLAWLRDRNIGVFLIDPQYVKDFEPLEHYSRVVDELARLADENEVGLIRRYASMRAIADRQNLSAHLAPDKFHLNDMGYRCLANYAARAISEAATPAVAGNRQKARRR